MTLDITIVRRAIAEDTAPNKEIISASDRPYQKGDVIMWERDGVSG